MQKNAKFKEPMEILTFKSLTKSKMFFESNFLCDTKETFFYLQIYYEKFGLEKSDEGLTIKDSLKFLLSE